MYLSAQTVCKEHGLTVLTDSSIQLLHTLILEWTGETRPYTENNTK